MRTKPAWRSSRPVSPPPVLVACSLALHALSVLCLGTPFRETGPPACMAKLIMLRHKVSSVPMLWRSCPAQADTHAPRLCVCSFSRIILGGEVRLDKPVEPHARSTFLPHEHHETYHGESGLGGLMESKIIDCIPLLHP